MSVCRTCLGNGLHENEMIGLYRTCDTAIKTVAELYVNCTSLPVDKCDGISNVICNQCYQKLIGFYQFRSLCTESYNFLVKNQLSQNQTPKAEFSGNYRTIQIKVEERVLADDLEGNDCGLGDEIYFEDASKYSSEVEMPTSSLDTEYDKYEKSNNLPSDECYDGENIQKEKDRKSNLRDTSKPQMTCDICQKVFFKKHRLEGHLRKHMGLKQFQCDICEDKQFAKWSTFKAHMHLYHTDGIEKVQYKCEFDGCDKSYNIKVSIRFQLLFTRFAQLSCSIIKM